LNCSTIVFIAAFVVSVFVSGTVVFVPAEAPVVLVSVEAVVVVDVMTNPEMKFAYCTLYTM
jgi:hypothetical protein